MLAGVAQETLNEILMRTENLVGVPEDKRGPQDMHHLRQRLVAIYQVVLSEYIMKSKLMTNKKTQALIKMGRQLSAEHLMPMYIRVKAVLLVSK